MTLDGFKFIFWWEWAHRLSGRLIGVVFLLPYLSGSCPRLPARRAGGKVFGFFILGGLQGAMGWYMVKSGLVDDPRVSQYRLAAHLGLAFLLFGLMFWTGLGMLQPRRQKSRRQRRRGHARLGNGLVALVFVMVLSGALVAGIRAGLAYNTFPLMNGHFLPPESLWSSRWWLNFFTNMALVQFDHRLIAWALMGLIPWLAWRIWNETPAARHPGRAAHAVAGGAGHARHRHAAAAGAGGAGRAHQAGAMVLFGCCCGRITPIAGPDSLVADLDHIQLAQARRGCRSAPCRLRAP
jgi:cytochrome c oxidase assembly protein subunit 15